MVEERAAGVPGRCRICGEAPPVFSRSHNWEPSSAYAGAELYGLIYSSRWENDKREARQWDGRFVEEVVPQQAPLHRHHDASAYPNCSRPYDLHRMEPKQLAGGKGWAAPYCWENRSRYDVPGALWPMMHGQCQRLCLFFGRPSLAPAGMHDAREAMAHRERQLDGADRVPITGS